MQVVQAVLETFPAMLKVFMVDSPTDKVRCVVWTGDVTLSAAYA